VRRVKPTLLETLALSSIMLILALLLPLTAFANAAPSRRLPESGGLVVPSTTSDVRIEREGLSFDLAAESGYAAVVAEYALQNVTDRAVSLDLVFIAPQGRDLAVFLGAQPLDARETKGVELPQKWLSPSTAVDPLTGDDYAISESMAIRATVATWAFHLELPPRSSQNLRATYRALLGYDRDRYDYVVRNLAYVLGPANNWAGFGTLDVKVTLPSKYILKTSPPLTKLDESGGVSHYGATFEGIPSEILRLATISSAATKEPTLAESWQQPFAIFFPVVAGLFVCLAMRRLFSRVKRVWLAGIGAAVAAFALTLVIAIALMLLLMYSPTTDMEDVARSSSVLTNGYLFILWVGWAAFIVPMLAAIISALLVAVGARSRAHSVG
jgi:hypothetical protein